jgi:hypothetical protein
MQQLNELAAQKIQNAAEQTELAARAETNTRSMLQRMLTTLGFTRVDVAFGPPPTASPTSSPHASSPHASSPSASPTPSR